MTIKEWTAMLMAQAKDAGLDLAAVQREVNRACTMDGVKPSTFKKLEIGREMYQECISKGISLSRLLEKEDPSENYAGVNLDAFERQLAIRGLNIAGKNAITLAEWYDDSGYRILFPEFIDREVRHGLLMGRNSLKAEDILATETQIDSGTYEMAIADETGDFSMKVIPEGTKFPRITISIAEKKIDLRKHGVIIEETYEHRRRLRANKMAVFLRLVGWHMAKDMAEDAVDIAINGNTGNSNGAFSHTDTGLTYDNLIDFWAEFDPYEVDTLVLPKLGLTGILKLTEFKDPLIASRWLTNGELITPLGNVMKRHDPTTASVLTNKVLGVDKRFALEGITESGSYIVETDKIIDGQWDQIAISLVRGFGKIIATAAGVWDYS